MEDTVVFLTGKALYFCEFLMRKLLSQRNRKGTVLNRALSSLHGGSLEITLTVPLTLQVLASAVG